MANESELFFILLLPWLDFQPFCEPKFPHHGWINGIPHCILNQSQTNLLQLSLRLAYSATCLFNMTEMSSEDFFAFSLGGG